MRVVRFELQKDGEILSLFRSNVYEHYTNSMVEQGEYWQFRDMLDELPVPRLKYHKENYVFYFTREGLKRFKKVIALIRKHLTDGVKLVMKRAWDLGSHSYADDFQVAIKA